MTTKYFSDLISDIEYDIKDITNEKIKKKLKENLEKYSLFVDDPKSVFLEFVKFTQFDEYKNNVWNLSYKSNVIQFKYLKTLFTEFRLNELRDELIKNIPRYDLDYDYDYSYYYKKFDEINKNNKFGNSFYNTNQPTSTSARTNTSASTSAKARTSASTSAKARTSASTSARTRTSASASASTSTSTNTRTSASASTSASTNTRTSASTSARTSTKARTSTSASASTTPLFTEMSNTGELMLITDGDCMEIDFNDLYKIMILNDIPVNYIFNKYLRGKSCDALNNLKNNNELKNLNKGSDLIINNTYVFDKYLGHGSQALVFNLCDKTERDSCNFVVKVSRLTINNIKSLEDNELNILKYLVKNYPTKFFFPLFIDEWKTENNAFVVMEKIKYDYADYIEKFNINITEFNNMCLETLDELHNLNIIHGDFSYNNIMFRDDLIPVIIDFGYSVVFEKINKGDYKVIESSGDVAFTTNNEDEKKKNLN